MPYIDFGVNLLGHAVIVKPEFAEKNPEAIRNFSVARCTVSMR